MSTPIYDLLSGRLALATANPEKPTQTLMTGRWSIWCVVCEREDFMHEHPGDPRAPRVGDPAVRPTIEEAAWMNGAGTHPFTGGYRGPFRPSEPTEPNRREGDER